MEDKQAGTEAGEDTVTESLGGLKQEVQQQWEYPIQFCNRSPEKVVKE